MLKVLDVFTSKLKELYLYKGGSLQHFNRTI